MKHKVLYMTQHQDQLATLEEIRSLMQRSSRFTSVSGLSGILAGLVALVGVGIVNWYLTRQNMSYTDVYKGTLTQETSLFLVIMAVVVLMLAMGSVLILTWLKAQKAKQSIWHQQGQRLFSNLCIPLAAGGVFCVALLYHHLLYLVAPSMLVFYGLAMIHSSKYTFPEFRHLGLAELALGLFACFQIEYGLVAWGIGFGVLHILYGALLYVKYEKNQSAGHLLVAKEINP